MFTSNGPYVLKDGGIHSVCYGIDQINDAAKSARLHSVDECSELVVVQTDRLPHPATQMKPLPDLDDFFHGDPVGRHD